MDRSLAKPPPNETVATIKNLLSICTDESGQDLVEYAMLIGLVALAVIAAVVLLGEILSDLWCELGREMKKISGEPPKSCIGKGKGL